MEPLLGGRNFRKKADALRKKPLKPSPRASVLGLLGPGSKIALDDFIEKRPGLKNKAVVGRKGLIKGLSRGRALLIPKNWPRQKTLGLGKRPKKILAQKDYKVFAEVFR
jgi:hypothetical protein